MFFTYEDIAKIYFTNKNSNIFVCVGTKNTTKGLTNEKKFVTSILFCILYYKFLYFISFKLFHILLEYSKFFQKIP
jgi:hypothetical protein